MKLVIDWLIEEYPVLSSLIRPEIKEGAREMQVDAMYDAWHDGNENGMKHMESIIKCENFFGRTDGMQYIEENYDEE